MTRAWLNSGRMLMLGALVAAAGSSGCTAAFTERGIAARRVPKELLVKPRANKVDIDFALLRQEEPAEYRLEPKDILGIYIEKILPDTGGPPPVNIAKSPEKESQNPPSVGYSVPVQEDGTISLPSLDPIKVTGMTIKEVDAAVRKAYADSDILQNNELDKLKIIVTLQRKRTYQVLVIREDAGGQTTRSLRIGDQQVSTERGTGETLDLIAYQNDVLHALVETGGLPGIEAVDQVIILRSKFADAKKRMEIMAMIQQQQQFDPCSIPAAFGESVGVTRIPLRLEKGEAPTFNKEDIILKTGDIVFVDSRKGDYFYTGGALTGSQIPLPRDYDVDILEAVALAGGPVGGGGANFRAGSVGAGVGSFGSLSAGAIPPSRVNILRQVEPNGQINIQIDLKKALEDPSERVLIGPGDILVLGFTPGESFANLFLSTFPFQTAWIQLLFTQ